MQDVNLPVRVLVVDDSALMRRIIIDILKANPDIKVVGYARNGQDALEKIPLLKPQIVTLDVEMPVMDGISTLKAIMDTNPLPVVMFSSHTTAAAEVTIKALELGAVDFILKPPRMEDMKELTRVLPEKIKMAAAVPETRLTRKKSTREKITHPAVSRGTCGLEIIAIGTSTGGPSALSTLVSNLPGYIPVGLVVAQHMPRGFTGPLARRLNELSALEVREAVDGDEIRPGLVLVAPAGSQMVLERKNSGVVARITDKADIKTPFKPSVDVLFLSVARVYGARCMGVILTGMGSDGVRGLKAIKEQGGLGLAQDEASSIIFGMPKAAIEAGLTDKVVPLTNIASEIMAALG